MFHCVLDYCLGIPCETCFDKRTKEHCFVCFNKTCINCFVKCSYGPTCNVKICPQCVNEHKKYCAQKYVALTLFEYKDNKDDALYNAVSSILKNSDNEISNNNNNIITLPSATYYSSEPTMKTCYDDQPARFLTDEEYDELLSKL